MVSPCHFPSKSPALELPHLTYGDSFPDSPRNVEETSFYCLLRQLQWAHEAEIKSLRLNAHATPEQDIERDVRCSEPKEVVCELVEKEATADEDLKAHKRSGIQGLGHIRSPVAANGTSRRRACCNLVFRLITNKWFDIFFCFLITVNAFVMAFEAQYNGYGIGHKMGYKWHSQSPADRYPYADEILEVLAWGFGIMFTSEILLKIVAYGWTFMCDSWNVFDFVVVAVWVVSKLGQNLQTNTTVFRLARLARLLRLVKLVRKLQGFDALFVITTAMKGCVSVLVWTFVMLGLVQMMIALFLNQALHAFYFSESGPWSEDEEVVFRHFGTFVRAFFTMFEITLGNWPPACRILAENVHEVFFMLGLMHKLSVGFAVVAIINGVFMQETFKVSSMDDVLMVRQKERAQRFHLQKMEALLLEADAGGDGQISLEEWQELLKDPTVRIWLSSMELDTSDAELVFELIDSTGDGQLDFQELMAGVSRLRGSARSIDLEALRRSHNEMMHLLRRIIAAPPT
eukprot:TRINITY_DN16988_c0_g2_i1.p1 TRINITY_DN16988_c0_g2~~TRINITY_DN16988_c0_g2_i1.p1  ORF type:complete len:515 (-),score=98.05 TRINITY_DN16988_c0_g2_i1:473-2017(-)